MGCSGKGNKPGLQTHTYAGVDSWISSSFGLVENMKIISAYLSFNELVNKK